MSELKTLPPNRSVTILDIAKLVNLSPTTVSCVLHGNAKKRRIADETIKKIMAAAESLNYIPNQLAQSLRRQRSMAVGVIFADMLHGWANAVQDGMLRNFNANDYVPFITTHQWTADYLEKEIRTLMQNRVEGIICCIPIEECRETYLRVRRQGMPFMFLGDTLPGMAEISSVAWDSGNAAKVAVQHLIEIGRKRIGFIGTAHPTVMTQRRYQAFRETIQEAGLPLHEPWIAWEPVVSSSLRSARDVMRPVLKRLFEPSQRFPDGLLFLNDALALAALIELDKLGVRVPDDVAIIGMGNIPEAENPMISLTTVCEPMVEMGEQAAALLLEMIENPAMEPKQILIECNQLIVRNSTVPWARS